MSRFFRPAGHYASLVIAVSIAVLMAVNLVLPGDSIAHAAPPQTAVTAPAPIAPGSFVVLGYNELGMHCMNQDFSEMCILPPYNNLRAQVIDRRGEEPRIVKSGVSLTYSIPGNTASATKTNFWKYSNKLFGVSLLPNIGLTGNGLSGVMKPTGANDWSATGIPITPLMDNRQLNPYPLSKINVVLNNKTVATTSAVVPVSWEISCNLCHNTPGISVATDILRKHDKRHKTKLEFSKPVLCAGCHADPALGTTGVKGVKSMSHAMHGSHASRMAPVAKLGNNCYACHPGFKLTASVTFILRRVFHALCVTGP